MDEKRLPDVPMPAESELPVYYRMGDANLYDVSRLEAMFPDTTFYWVNVRSQKNAQIKLWKGYKAITDKVMIERLGFTALVSEKGTIRVGEVELWSRPRAITDKAHDLYNERLAARSASVRAALDQQAIEAKDRTQGRVNTFLKTGSPDQDIFTRTPVSDLGDDAPRTPAPTKAKGKEK